MYSKNQKRYNNDNNYNQGQQQGYNQQRDGKYGGKPYQHRGPRQDEWEQYDRRGPKNQRDFQRPQTAYNGAPKSDAYSKYNPQQPSFDQRPQQPKYQNNMQQRVPMNPEPSAYRPFDNLPSKPSQKPSFNQRPQTSTVAQTGPSAKPGSAVSLVSNQFRVKIGGTVNVYQYALEIIGMEIFDVDLIQKICRHKRRALDTALGLYLVSGKCIYVLHELQEDVKFEVSYLGEKYTIVIEQSSQSIVTVNEKFDNQENTVGQQLLNIVIKTAFRETSLKQIGKTPRFFDVNNAMDLKEHQLRIMSGFKASVNQTHLGAMLCIDSIFKFMSTTSCLYRIMQIRANCSGNTEEWMARARNEFQYSSIIADWGNQRQYIVQDVCFDVNPISLSFEQHGEKISIAEYFARTYKKQITDPKQPLFLVKVAQKEFYLPTEFCLLDGVPESTRKGMGMRDALAHTRITPEEKLKKIKDMVSQLFSQKAIKDWDLEIEEAPVSISSKILPGVQMVTQKQVIHCDDNSLRKQTIVKPTDLLKDRWIMVYENNDRVFQAADSVYNNLVKASQQLGIKIEEPYWIEMKKENDRRELDAEIRQYIQGGGQFRHPTIVLGVFQRENNYEMFKEVMLQYSIPSQVVTFRNANKFNLSKATNIIRQVNSKAGGDLYYLKFPEVLDKKRTMLIGIDVCHAGPKSVVGLSCSINKEMSQYFSEHFIQPKGKEIVQDGMKEALMKAIRSFASLNCGEFPTNYVIYRDGVGDAQRLQVLSKEIPQFEAAINSMYNKAAYMPELTVVVVNKRISQRFFVKDERGHLRNPDPGCIIDKELVEDHGSESPKFDFYLTPSKANQGCVLPTHFFVPKNDSCLKKFDIQRLTYALCHFYFNWAGSIKVPAPCQYAHKIAEFFTNINAHKKKNTAMVGQESMQLRKAVEQKMEQKELTPITNRLHFL